MHLVAADEVRAVGFRLSPGQNGDGPEGRELIGELGCPAWGCALAMDMADEGDETRGLATLLGFKPVVPPHPQRLKPWQLDNRLYRERHHVARLFRRLKGFRRGFTRYDKLDALFRAFVTFALIWLALSPYNSVNRDGSIPRGLPRGWMPPAVIGAKPLSVIPRGLPRGGFIMPCGIVDAQSVKNADTAGKKGDDAGQKVSGIKRHLIVDPQGLPHAVAVTTAEITDRTGALLVIATQRENLTEVKAVLADGGYTGEPCATAVQALLGAAVKIAAWFKRRPRYHLHFTPTSGSWLDQIERWFAKITEQRLRRSAFHSVAALEKAIRQYLETNNRNPTPFVWTASADLILGKVEAFCSRINRSGY